MLGFRSALLGGSAVAAVLLVWMSPAAAADAPQSGSSVSEVVITGSRIPRTDTTTAEPVTVLSGADMTTFGYTQVGQLLNEVTSNVPSFATPPFVGAPVENAGRQSANLFNLGVGRTLTLVNGRRMVSTSSGLQDSAVDTNIIPAGLLQRVEIVQGSGSAVYGSDAIGGVVNFILQQNFQGAVLDAQYGSSTRGDYQEPSLHGTFGRNFAGGRGNVAVDLEWSQTGSLLQSDRPWSAADLNLVDNPAYTGQPGVPPQIYASNTRYWTLNPNGVIFTSPRPGPSYLAGGSAAKAVQFSPDGLSIIAYNPGGSVKNGDSISVGGQGEDPATTSSLASSVQRATATAIGHFELTPHMKVSGEFTFGHTFSNDPYSSQSVLRFAGGAVGEGQGAIAFTNANPYLTPGEIASLSAIDPAFASGGTLYESRFLNILPSRAETATTNTGRALVSLDGDFHALNRDFTWSGSFSHALSDGSNSQWQANNLHLVNALNTVRNGAGQIVCASADPACAPLDPFGNVPASQAAQSYVSVERGSKYFNIQDDFLATLGGDVITLPAGKVAFNAAFEHRYESANFKPSFADQTGQIFGGETTAPESGHYSTNEVSGELLVPIVGGDFTLPFVKALAFDGSYRYVDNTLAGKEDVWGVGGRWEVAYGITLRASKSRNFRAPTLDQLIAPKSINVENLGFDPCNANEINSGTNVSPQKANCAALFAANPQWGPLSSFNDPAVNTSIVAVTTGGNPDLKNETSDTLTYGFVYQPSYIPGLLISVDRVEIDLTNALTLEGPASFLSQCYDVSPEPADVCSTFTRDPKTGYVVTAKEETFNTGGIIRKGEIYNIDYRFPIDRFLPVHDWGTLEVGLEATHTAEVLNVESSGESYRTDGTIGDPSWNVRFDLHYTHGPLHLFYSAYYLPPSRISPGANIGNTPIPVVPSNTRHTISGQYDYHRITFRAGINNLTDQGPSYPTLTYGDLFGRQFFVGATAKF